MVEVTDALTRTIVAGEERIFAAYGLAGIEITNSDGQCFFVAEASAVEVLEALLSFARKHGPAAESRP